jgi:hypothetical protein
MYIDMSPDCILLLFSCRNSYNVLAEMAALFKTEPSEGQKCNLNRCFKSDRRGRDKGTKGIEEMKRGGQGNDQYTK